MSNTVEAAYYVSEDHYVVQVDSDEHRKELEARNVEIEEFSVDVPTDTIHVIAGQSDGYISTYYSKDKGLLDWWYDADCEYFGGTDSDSSFECAFFPEYLLTSVDDVMGNIYNEYVQRNAIEYLEANHPNLVEKWAKEWGIPYEQPKQQA